MRKASPSRISRTITDYFRLYRSRKAMAKRLTEKSRQHIIRQRKKGIVSTKIAKDLGITARHVRRLWARFQKIGTTRVKMGRPHVPVTAAQIRMVTDAYQDGPVGVLRTAKRLSDNHDIWCTIRSSCV